MEESNVIAAPTYSVQVTSPQHSKFNDKKLSFQDLPSEWLECFEKNGIKNPTAVQETTFYPIREGHDVLAQSMTGSGKTLAFALPLALNLLESESPRDSNKPAVLILTPTRELADQIARVYKETLAPCKLRVVTVIGGVPYSKQEQALRNNPQIVVGTPGRISDLIRKNILSLKSLNSFVLDEVDQMLDIGFAKELNFIRENLPEKSQTLFFSATLNREASRLAGDLLDEPVHVTVKNNSQSPKSIEHGYLQVKPNCKLSALVACLVYYNPSQAIIFCETKKECADVSYTLSQKGFNVSQLNSDLNQYERQLAMKQFKHGKLQFLVATNVAARGIDVQDLPLVVNYTPPKDRESYTHRVGRTGRAGATGKAWTMVSPSEHHWFQRLLRMVQADAKRIDLPNSENFMQTVVSRELSKMDHAEPSSDTRSIELESVEKSLSELDNDQVRSLLAQVLAKTVQKFNISDPSKYLWDRASAPVPSRPPSRSRPVRKFQRKDTGRRYGSSEGSSYRSSSSESTGRSSAPRPTSGKKTSSWSRDVKAKSRQAN